MNAHIKKAGFTQGFTLVQLSIIITVAALVLVAMLPGYQTTLNANSVTTARMNAVLLALRQYEAANGVLPCPADASLPMGSVNYGVAAANPGYTTSTQTNACTGGTPAANFVDTTLTGGIALSNVAIGMVPVRTLGLSNDYALDGYGRFITYAVDAYATGNGSGQAVWSVPSEPTPTSGEPTTMAQGQIIVADNGVNVNTVVGLVSHGADGHGAWLPLNVASGTGVRLNAGSTDTDQLVNAHLQSTGTFPNSTTSSLVTDAAGATVTFVRKPPTSTFDDLVVYKNPLWNINQLPVAQQSQSLVSLSLPANGAYVTGEPLTFAVTFPGSATVANAGTYCIGTQGNKTPRLDFTINGTTRYAYCLTGSGTKTLTFAYTLTPADYASEAVAAGISVVSPIDLNGATATSGGITVAGTNAVPLYFALPNGGTGLLNGAGSGSTNTNVIVGVTAGAPSGIVVDTSTYCTGSVACIDVVDTLNSRVTQWRKDTLVYGNLQFGALGTGNGLFTNPSGIVADSSNNLYVVDSGATTGNDNRVEQFSYGQSETLTIAGTHIGGAYAGDVLNVTFNSAALGSPTIQYTTVAGDTTTTLIATHLAAAINANTTITGAGIVTISSANVITIIYPTSLSLTFSPAPTVTLTGGGNETITPAAGTLAYHYDAQFGSYGTTAGTFHYPTGIAIDTTTNCGGACLWITDTGNNKLQSCSLFNSSSTSTCTITGTASYGGYSLSSPTGIATSVLGTGCTGANTPCIYVADTANNRIVKFTGAGGVVSYVTAIGSAGYGSGNFESPTGVAVDGSGNVWVTDSMNNRVEEFNSSGTWQLTVGGGGLCATGVTCSLKATNPATTSGSPSSAANTVYCNSTSGCLAGTGTSYFNNPTGITISGSNVYVVDDNNSRVQVFTTAGAYSAQFGSYGTGNSNFSF